VFNQQFRQAALYLGFTAILVGYFAVWLPGPAAGLQLIGLEIGEWIKFLGVGPRRDLFYLPPITLGLMLALLTVGWSNGRWQTWAMRGLAAAVSLLALPAIQSVTTEPRSEWLLRLALIGLVWLVVLGSGLLSGREQRPTPGWVWGLMALLGLAGLVLPTWEYLAARPLVSQMLGLPVEIGLGVWLNAGGHLLVGAVSLYNWRQVGRRSRKLGD
jgi:hypothetical protein